MGRLLGTRGAVIPAAPVPLRLEAVVDGEPVVGQVAIAGSRGKIEELRIDPPGVEAPVSATSAIAGADQVVVGPGSLFTSTIAALKVPGLVEAINASPASLVQVCNLTTQDGETLGMDAAAHVRALCSHTGMRTPDVVLAHQGPIAVPPGLQAVDADREVLEEMGCEVVTAELADPGGAWPQHDPARLGAVLRRLA